MARRRKPDPLAPKTVSFKPDGNGYGICDCSWEVEPRQQAVSLEAARKFAEGWKAEFEVEAAW